MTQYVGTPNNDRINGPSVAADRDQIGALGGNDTVTLGPNQTFISGPGDDIVIGTDGTSHYALWFAKSIPFVDLQQGYALDGFGGRDQLSGIGTVHMSGLGGTVIGSSNNETVFVFGGKNEIDMGSGVDTVIYHQQLSTSYDIVRTGSELRLRNLSSGLIDTLKNVEYIKFVDITINVGYDQSRLKAAFQYTAYTFTETGTAPGYVYAGVSYPSSLVMWFVQAPFTLDLDGDGKLDIVAPMNKGYASGLDTRVPFIALTGASGTLKFDPSINSQMPVTAGARHSGSIHLIASGTDGVVTIAHDTGDGKLADLTMLTDGLAGPLLSAYMPKLPAALPNRDYTVNAHSMAVGDINGDGVDDILVGDWSSPSGMYALIQQADGRFNISYQDAYRAIISNWPLLKSSSEEQHNLLLDLHLVDVNGDGYNDLIAGWGNGSTHSYVFLNNQGAFSIANKIALPDSIYGVDNQQHLRTFHFDFNNDGAMDLAILWSRVLPYYGGNYIQLLQNDGSGNFTDVTATRIDKPAQDAMGSRLHWTNYWQLLDVNGDGAIDIVGQRTGASSSPVAYLNYGNGHFTVTEIPTNALDVGQIIQWADLDRDGTVEMVEFRSGSDATGTSSENQFNVFKLTGDALLPMRSNPIKMGTMLPDVLVGNDANNMLIGKQGNDTIDGSGGIDTVIYSAARTSFSVVKSGAGFIVTDSTGNQGTDTLVNVERLKFSSGSLALDVSGNAGTVAKIIGSVFGAGVIKSRPEYVGIGLNYLDGGMNYSDLMQLAIDARLGGRGSNTEVVNLLYTNVVGSAPDAGSLAYYKDLLDNGTFTQGSLGVLAADTSINTTNINLVGLTQTGVEFS
jgi:hypothetical protein